MGGYCQRNSNIPSLSTIDLVCDEDASSPTIAYQFEVDCNYRFQLRSRHACPVEQTTTTGSANLTTTITITTISATTSSSTSTSSTSSTSSSTGKATNRSSISLLRIMFVLTFTLVVGLL
eukprot:TRINITY_DN1855_c0_g1_i3.p2 TRINITY_DN1855_c0_g1~~TRINITY_DN1855_c0_g1_i3.p2  ORF type:complete len:120 (-),score=29.75 TRINITY_DN1855_c0_g1_i3:78-437(-)